MKNNLIASLGIIPMKKKEKEKPKPQPPAESIIEKK